MLQDSTHTHTYLKVALYSIIQDRLLLVEPLHHTMHNEVPDSRLVVGLLCIHQYPDIVCDCQL